MSNYVTARDELVTHLHPLLKAAFPDIPVFYENTVQVDLDKVGDMFITIAVGFDDSSALGVDSVPMSMTLGEVVFRVFVKSGVGTRRTLQIMDGITSIMKYKNLASVRIECPYPGRKISKDGWTSLDLNAPFYFIQ